MFKKYLKLLWEIDINLIATKKIGKKYLNVAIFWDCFPKDLFIYKRKFINLLDEKKKNIEKISKIILSDNNLTNLQKYILNNEIFIRLKKIEFLKIVYDIEAHKLDKNYDIKETIEDYDYYNKIFFWVTKNDIKNDIKISKNKNYDIFITKRKLEQLLNFSKNIIPELNWSFWDYTNLSHNNWLLKIPNKEKYNIKRIIVIFFHEMTHFFRYLNWKNNIWFNFVFTDSNILEEWITWYNEYYYWNQIINYGEYNAYYDKCYQIILNNSDKEIIKKEFYNVLKNKWFTIKQMDFFYLRFYKYTKIWWKDLFLKDLIYNKSYNDVLRLIKKDKNNYKKIISWHIGLDEFKNNIITTKNNFDDEYYFNTILKEIKKLI